MSIRMRKTDYHDMKSLFFETLIIPFDGIPFINIRREWTTWPQGLVEFLALHKTTAIDMMAPLIMIIMSLLPHFFRAPFFHGSSFSFWQLLWLKVKFTYLNIRHHNIQQQNHVFNWSSCHHYSLYSFFNHHDRHSWCHPDADHVRIRLMSCETLITSLLHG